VGGEDGMSLGEVVGELPQEVEDEFQNIAEVRPQYFTSKIVQSLNLKIDYSHQ